MDRSELHENEAERLLAAARRGDERSFRLLYDAYHVMVCRTAHRLVGAAESLDVAQDVFVTFFRKMGAFNGRSTLKTWLYRLTVNVCYDHMRKNKRRSAYRGGSIDDKRAWLWTATSSANHTSVRVLRRDVQDYVEESMGELSPELRATLILKDVEDLSYREIAAILGCAEGTIASRLARARRQLAEHLRAVGIDAAYFE